MKLTAILLFAACMQVSASGFSQKITLSQTNVSLKKVFKEIERQSGYHFFYKDRLLRQVEDVSIHVRDASVQETLDLCLKGKPLTYSILDKIIVIKEKKLQVATEAVPVLPELTIAPVNIITGIVKDIQGNPLAGVSVVVKGTGRGTSTGANGSFSIDANVGDVLEFTMVGYQEKSVSVGKQSEVNVVLELEISGLSDVVVVGYGTQKKKDLTGAVAVVDTKQVQNVPAFNVQEALIGKVSGVQVINNTGEPGSRIEVKVRGDNSMIGNNSPLYVINGFPIVGGIGFLPSADIESISILKDASATAIYGARGSNGVVLITTKSGKRDQDGHISFSSYYGIQSVAKRYKLLDAKQYATIANQFLVNNGGAPFFDVDAVKNPGTDWQDVVFRNAPIQDHTIAFSGSSEKGSYSISSNYFRQGGIVINSGAQRGSLNLNINRNLKEWLSLESNLILSRSEIRTVPANNGQRSNNMFFGALSAPPTLPVLDKNGLPTRIENEYSFGFIDMRNPLLWDKPYKNKSLGSSAIINNALNFKITKELSFKTQIGIQYQNISLNNYTPIIYQNDRGSASSNFTEDWSILNNNILNYNKRFNDKHNLEVMGGFTYQSYTTRNTGISVSDFLNNITENYNLGAASTLNAPTSGISKWVLASWLGRVNYSFEDKYYVTANIRADGSSRFGSANRWGIFPGGALAWRISRESFLENAKFINDLKLRISYGLTGSTAIEPYQTLSRLSTVRYIYEGNTESVGYAPTTMSNNKLKWETTKEFDLGFDLDIFEGRIGLTFDYYSKNTIDLLASVPLPPSVGYSFTLQNIGKIRNSGVEFSLNTDIFRTKDFNWNVIGQLSINRNKVTSLAGGSDIVSAGELVTLPGYNLARVGEPIGVFYGFKEAGLDEHGKIKYVDENKDGKITPEDRIILGSPYPNFIYGLSSSLSYKNFDLNIFLQGTYGNDIFWRIAYDHLNSFNRGENQFADLIGNYWTSDNPNPNAKYPVISNSTLLNVSNRFVKDGSYLRVKTLQLSYNFHLQKLRLKTINALKVYIRATNLFTLTSYPGLDPEVNSRATDSQEIQDRLVIGTDESGYPNARSFGVGCQISF